MSTFTTSATAFVEARKRGLRVVVPESNTLTLDIDSEEAFQNFRKQLEILENDIETSLEYTKTVSPSEEPGHYHIYLEWPKELPELSIPCCIALQACLGSDPTRELSSILRWIFDDPTPILLFEKKHLIDPTDVRSITEVRSGLFVVKMKSDPDLAYPIWVEEKDIEALINHFDILES